MAKQRYNIMVNPCSMDKIDKFASELGISRSKFIVDSCFMRINNLDTSDDVFCNYTDIDDDFEETSW